MPDFADIYVLSKNRDKASILTFLESFACFREQSADEYEVLQYAQSPARIFRTPEELIDHCCHHKEECHAIYWRVLANEASHAMLFFLSDGHVIYGLSVDSEKQASIDRLRDQMTETLEASPPLVLWECAPPDSATEFIAALSKQSESLA